MRFSYEELYFMFGQYDSFVSIEFEYNSQSYIEFGKTIMGVFIYSKQEREDLQESLKYEINQRTSKNIKFSPKQRGDCSTRLCYAPR